MVNEYEFVDIILSLDMYGKEKQNFREIILNEPKNMDLFVDYFFNDKQIKNFIDSFTDASEREINLEKKIKFIETLVDMYPLSKNLLDKLILEGDFEKSILNKYASKNNLFIKGIEKYIKNI